MVSKVIKSVLIIVLLYSIGCNSEKNEINFEVSIRELTDSLKSISQSFEKYDDFKNYYYDKNNYFYLNSNKFFKVSKNKRTGSLNFNIKDLDQLNQIEQEIFYKSIYLKENKIDGAYLSRIHGAYMFGYRNDIHTSFDTRRDIILVNKNNEKQINKIKATNTIIDRKNGLILVKPNRLN